MGSPRALFADKLPKDPAFSADNEDTFEIDLQAGRLVLVDGASESYDSRTWGRLLATRFMVHPRVGPAWAARAAAEYARLADRDSLSWSKQAAFDRGSFATLLGVQLGGPGASVRLTGLGDSVAVLLDGSRVVDTFPYSSAQEFDQRPALLSTNGTMNAFLSSRAVRTRSHRIWSLDGLGEPVLVCMTDGIAQWVFRRAEQGTPVWDLVAGIRDPSELDAIVQRERADRTMRVDDVTLVTVALA